MGNRLANSISPYLRQHAENPVDWWEWSPEAFAEAKRRDVPVLLSVGYAACHWCHVMAHESFEDEGVAAAMNADFVSIKVDREERPDIDAVYMTATQAMTGRGGWPMTCVLTPDGEPFFAGTYFPKPQFLHLLDSVSTAWRDQRDEIVQSGTAIADRLRALVSASSTSGSSLGADDLAMSVERIRGAFDDRFGGFGGAPKFPPTMILEWLLRHHARTGDDGALDMVTATAGAMARGGMYDQLAGGFARYSVDAGWVVPHFEKMLYDNAQLVRVYTHLHRATGDDLAHRIASETADFIIRDLGTGESGFASALDADTDGVEGLTYVWTPDQLIEVLGAADGRRATDLLHVTASGTFEDGASTLQLRTDPDDPAWWDAVRTKLAASRAGRPQPARDDKVVTSWNGLAIAGLADAGITLGRADLVEVATRCAEFVVGHHLVDGRLRRVSRDAVVGQAAGMADDYGNLAEGLLTLHQATGDARWLTVAGEILDGALTLFRDDDGTLHDAPHDGEDLVFRPRSDTDNAEPSGRSALAGALLTHAALTGSSRHREIADEALSAGGLIARQEPRFAGWTLAVAEAAVAGPLQVAIVGSDDTAQAMLEAARRSTSPGLVIAHGEPDSPGEPLLAARPFVDGGSAAYVCRGFVCDRPVTTVAELEQSLTQPLATSL